MTEPHEQETKQDAATHYGGRVHVMSQMSIQEYQTLNSSNRSR